MSLYEEAEGLLGTHVTWQDIEDEMRKSLGTNAKFGENKKAVNISDMKGFMSRIALVEPDWVGELSSENLPKIFVVKISSQLALLAMAKMMNVGDDDVLNEQKMKAFSGIVRQLHNREVATYSLLLKLKVESIPITKIYAMKPFSEDSPLKAFIISEYIDNLSHIPLYETLHVADLLPIVRSVAAFSALGETVPREDLSFAGDANLLASLLGEYSEERILNGIFSQMKSAFPQEYEEKVDRLIKIYRYYMDPKTIGRYEKVVDIIGHKPVLTHGDLWAANLLCVRNDDHVDFRAIIDWQTVSIGSPGLDVGRLFVSTLTTADRREKLDFLMEEYYNSLIENLHGRPAPYTLEQLKNNYQLLFPIISMMVLPGIIPFFEMSQVAEEQRLEIRKNALNKMVGLLEDVITTHEKNLKDFPDFYIDN